MARKLAEVSKSEPSIDDLSSQISTLREDVAKLTELLGQYGAARGAQVKSAVSDKFAHIKDEGKLRAELATEAAGKQISDLQGQADDFIKSQPATAMGIAAGLGFLLGFVSGRK